MGVLIALVAGVGLWAVNASDARLAQTWPDVAGKDLPVPFPLSEAEVAHLRQKKRQRLGGAQDSAAQTRS